MARTLTQLEHLEMLAIERMGYRVEVCPTQQANLLLARFQHPTGDVLRYLNTNLLPGHLEQICDEIQRGTA